jgi:Domain of unknown function (DUF4912)
MENLPARTVNGSSASGWFATAGTFAGRVWSALRAFRGALHQKEPRREGGQTQPPSWLEHGELPESYGRTKVVAMAVSPYLIHVYWDLPANQLARTTAGSLRFHDTAEGESFDVNVDLSAKNWYVHLWSPEKRYSVELMVNQKSGPVSVATSNPVETPRAWPVADVRERFTRVEPAPTIEPAALPIGDSAQSRPPHQPMPAQPVRVTEAVERLPVAKTPSAPSFKAETPVVEPRVFRPPVRPIPAPVNAIDVLRQKLGELYGLRRWHAPPRPALAAVSVEAQRPHLLDTIEAGVDIDFTTRVESEFSPGLSSVLLGVSSAKKPVR